MRDITTTIQPKAERTLQVLADMPETSAKETDIRVQAEVAEVAEVDSTLASTQHHPLDRTSCAVEPRTSNLQSWTSLQCPQPLYAAVLTCP